MLSHPIDRATGASLRSSGQRMRTATTTSRAAAAAVLPLHSGFRPRDQTSPSVPLTPLLVIAPNGFTGGTWNTTDCVNSEKPIRLVGVAGTAKL